MNGPSKDRNKLRRGCIAAVTFALASVVLTIMNAGGSNLAVGSTEFGIPLTFLRAYVGGPLVSLNDVLTNDSIVRLFFIRALVFDVIVALLLLAATVFTIDRWSASWTLRRHVAFYVCCTILGALVALPLTVDVPMPVGFVLLFVFVLAIPIFFLCCTAYSIGFWTQRSIRPVRGWIACFLLMGALIGFGKWAYPHDAFEEPSFADLPFLLERRSSENPRMRQLAVRALGRLKVNDDAVVNALVDSISDANHVVRTEAMSGVTRFGTKSARAVPALVAAFREKNFGFLAASALGDIGPNAKAAVPVLRTALPTAKDYDKLTIAEALWKIERNAPLVVPPLIELLNDKYGPLRVAAARILGRIGTPAKAAVPILVEMARHVPAHQPAKQPDSVPAQSADSDAPRAVIREMTEEEFYPQIRAAAAEALEKIERKTATAMDERQGSLK
jgi:hypothetical protein